jgi:hypothetical protein
MSVSSPTYAVTVVGCEPARKVRLTGITGTPTSIAAWNSAGRKGPLRRPHQVVPSGNTATTRPARSAALAVATVVGSCRGRYRSTKIAPLAAATQPITGQSRTSRLARRRAGEYARITSTSSQDT